MLFGEASTTQEYTPHCNDDLNKLNEPPMSMTADLSK